MDPILTPEPSPVKIRPADRSDIGIVRRLIEELEEQPYPAHAFRQVYFQNLRNEHIYYWLAEIRGQSIGFLSLHIQYLLHHLGPVAEIQELVVTNPCRGSGAGSLLLATARQTARALGCRNLEVTCNQNRAAAHRFYEKNGLQATHLKFVERL